nr:hypothetical protein [Tanacetum cinerariifolium]
GRQTSFATSTTRTYTPGESGSISRKQKTVICYNYKGEGHMSKQCTEPRRKQDDSWFKNKVLLVQAQANGQIIHEEELAFLADLGIPEVALMANLSHYGLNSLIEVHNPDNVDNNMINQDVQVIPSSEQSNIVNHLETEITSDSNIISYSQPTKVEVLKEHPKVSIVNTSLKKLKHHLAGFDVVVKEKTMAIAITEDSWGKKFIITALKNDLRKFKGKALVDDVVTSHTIAPETFKVDVEPLAPKLLNNRTAHSDYLRHTREQAAILRKVVEPGKSQNPLNNSLDHACMYTKKFRRVKPSTSASESQPLGNNKKDKIQRPPSSTQKNKVEAHPRIIKSSLKNKNCAVKPKGTASVQHSKLNVNSKLICVKCNGCMLSDNHDLCVLNDVNARAKSKSVKKNSKRKV